mmetsp:Transcript_34248/g.65417  ORF Transcript_34248/g.65417 Transcript_34248/m.65417 type:complete len:256 (+) Transcript_34248:330-1097(+)
MCKVRRLPGHLQRHLRGCGRETCQPFRPPPEQALARCGRGRPGRALASAHWPLGPHQFGAVHLPALGGAARALRLQAGRARPGAESCPEPSPVQTRRRAPHVHGRQPADVCIHPRAYNPSRELHQVSAKTSRQGWRDSAGYGDSRQRGGRTQRDSAGMRNRGAAPGAAAPPLRGATPGQPPRGSGPSDLGPAQPSGARSAELPQGHHAPGGVMLVALFELALGRRHEARPAHLHTSVPAASHAGAQKEAADCTGT